MPCMPSSTRELATILLPASLTCSFKRTPAEMPEHSAPDLRIPSPGWVFVILAAAVFVNTFRGVILPWLILTITSKDARNIALSERQAQIAKLRADASKLSTSAQFVQYSLIQRELIKVEREAAALGTSSTRRLVFDQSHPCSSRYSSYWLPLTPPSLELPHAAAVAPRTNTTSHPLYTPLAYGVPLAVFLALYILPPSTLAAFSSGPEVLPGCFAQFGDLSAGFLGRVAVACSPVGRFVVASGCGAVALFALFSRATTYFQRTFLSASAPS